MDRVRMEVVGLTGSPQNSGAYALILRETGGDRRLSILIGQDAAHSIAVELEAIQPARPITHDLLKSVVEALGSTIVEVTITDLREGTYYALIRLSNTPNEIDARPSDAIALAIRFGSPIYVLVDVLEKAESSGQHVDEEFFDSEEEDEEYDDEGEEGDSPRPLTLREKLLSKLADAVDREDYEVAAKIRDEIERLDRTQTDS